MPVRDLLSAASGVDNFGPSDPNFEYNTLLLNGDGTNGAQNNTFLDSSTNNFTITRNGNTTQGSFSPYGDNWGWYFNGSSVLSTSFNNQIVPVGTQNFTIEGWFFLTAAISSERNILDNNAAAGGFNWYYDGTTYGVYANSVGSIVSTSYAIATNQWVHLAITRSGNTFTLYVNGTSIHSGTSSQSFAAQGSGGAGNPTIMGRSSSNRITGYVSNMRVVLGSVVYTGNFTPSTTPLTAVSGTALLLQKNRFIDSSSNNYTLIVGGSPSVQRFSPFNPTAPYSTSVIGGSGYFDGSGDSLSIGSSNTVLPTGTQDFSVECYVYWGTQSGSFPQIIANPTTTGFQIYYDVSGGTLAVGIFNVANVITYSIAQSALSNRWTHIAVTRSGNTFRLFVDGVLQANGTNVVSYASPTTQYIGSDGSRPFTGYISDVKSTLGSIPTTYQTSSTTNGTGIFTAPTAPITTSSQGSTSADVELLVNFTNAGIPDLAMQNNLETVGNAQVSTSVKKYGTGSIAFDGTTDGLVLASNPPQVLSGNFTIEGWVYLNNTTGLQTIIGRWQGSNQEYLLWVVSGVVQFYFGAFSVATPLITASSSLSATTWTHIAAVRNGSTFTVYINGTSAGTATNSSAMTVTTAATTVGSLEPGYSGYDLTGYIDDLRVTNGFARYTANFTPPTAALPTF
jgi:hypothetical protein